MFTIELFAFLFFLSFLQSLYRMGMWGGLILVIIMFMLLGAAAQH